MARNITSVSVRWDDQDGATPGWYAEAKDADGVTVTDSQKISFPLNVDEFAREDQGPLTDALADLYPESRILID